MKAVLLVAMIVLVSFAVSVAEAAWPQARWKRPTGISEQGDRRYLMQKYMRKVVEDAKVEDPIPKPPQRRKSRSYHFAYGPIYPNHHNHLKYGDSFYPEPHMLYY
jgi:hypothetical protein